MSAPGNREVAHRLFAAEFDDAEYSYSESDEERAPNYVVSPTGARVNRLFTVGVLTEVSQAGDSILRARVVDPTGAFVVYAGQYQPEAMAFLDRTTPPAFVAVTGKARTFQPDDSDVVYTSVRPESISAVDADTRDRWTVTTAERTLERVGTFAAALETGLTGDSLREALVRSGVDESLATGIPIAIEQYGTTRAYLAALQNVALDAVRHVTGDVEEVDAIDVAPGEGGDIAFTPAVDVTIDAEGVAADEGEAADRPGTEPAAEPTGEPVSESEPAATTATTGTAGESASETDTTGGVTGDPEPTASDDGGVETPATGEEATADADIGTGPEADPGAGTDTTTEAEAGTGTPEASEPADTTATTDPPEEPAAADATGEPTDDTSGEAGDPGEFDAEEFDLDDETRREVEEEFGTDFSTGNEVAPAGEADIETPDPDADADPGSDLESDAEPEQTADADMDTDVDAEPAEPAEPAGTDDDEPTFEAVDPDEAAEADEPTDDDREPASEGPAREPPVAEAEEPPEPAEGDDDAAPAADVDVDDVLLDVMRDLDEGDGADREELVARVREETGADEAAVEDAIQDALMSGQCYEPEDGRLTPI